jgi:hypothetical protein
MSEKTNYDLFGNPIVDQGPAKPRNTYKNKWGAWLINPMIIQFKEREGFKCKTCDRLYRKIYHNKRYYKCELRGNTNGPGTDHRVNWPACGKYIRNDGGEVQGCGNV